MANNGRDIKEVVIKPKKLDPAPRPEPAPERVSPKPRRREKVGV